ncbi:MAG: type II toxin-antitoxin system PemK/MazF family toxin [Bifidobacteriaceae bacterium]|jgi:mRNA-degrading endonuclease toxin of MazEF toxin-antitoxin module|nr:type II toxin-antitoxin system PemK/MazF family toxin [Bifidobacteriaceae bacterium]
MTASSRARPFDIWLAYLRFADRPQTGKVRPVLVVAVKEDLIAVAKATSRPPASNSGDVGIAGWRQAGLNVPSTVRCSQVFELAPGDLLRGDPIGRLPAAEIDQVALQLVALGYFE